MRAPGRRPAEWCQLNLERLRLNPCSMVRNSTANSTQALVTGTFTLEFHESGSITWPTASSTPLYRNFARRFPHRRSTAHRQQAGPAIADDQFAPRE